MSSLGPYLGARLGPRSTAIAVPSGFPWTPSFTVREERLGTFAPSIDITGLRITPARTLYVDIATGSDAGTGSLASPYKSIWKALNQWSVAQTIYVKAGWYPVTNSWTGGVPFGASVNVIGVRDFATLAPAPFVSSVSEDVAALTWTSLGGGRWSASVANAPYAVVDVSTATPTWFTAAADAASADTAGEYFHGAGTLTVRTLTGGQPAATLRVLRDGVHNGWVNTALSLTVENGVFEGGGNIRAFWLQNVATGTFIDCEFMLSEGAGFELNTNAAGVAHAVNLIRCRTHDNTNDGIAYTALGAGSSIRALEWDCEAFRNGRNAGSNQGSSMHFFAGNTETSVVRIGGRYYSNEAQEIADVGGSTVWMLGVAMDGGGSGIGYELAGASAAWLHGCTILSCANDLKTDNASGVIHVASTTYAPASVIGAGTVQEYTP